MFKVGFLGSFLSKVGTSGLLGMRLSYWDCLRTVWVIGTVLEPFELLGTVWVIGEFFGIFLEYFGNILGIFGEYWGAV